MTSAYPTLVLNADFSPISTYPLSTWDFEKTMNKVLKGKVIILETYDVVLRSPSFNYSPPSVVALKNYIKRPDYVSFTRLNLFLRDDFKCQYCGRKHPSEGLTFDHVIPRARGGLTNWENIVAACVPCNSRKGHSMDMKPINPPMRPSSRELRRKRRLSTENLHQSWLDYLYWSGVLESD